MGEIREKLDAYTEELLVDLKQGALSEEKQAEIYTRLEERLKVVIMEELGDSLSENEKKLMSDVFDEQNYGKVEELLKDHPKKKRSLETKIDTELQRLKDIIIKEQQHV